MNDIYTIKPGDTLSDIAARNGMTLNQLLEANPTYQTNPYVIYPGQTLQMPIPAEQMAQAQEKASEIIQSEAFKESEQLATVPDSKVEPVLPCQKPAPSPCTVTELLITPKKGDKPGAVFKVREQIASQKAAQTAAVSATPFLEWATLPKEAAEKDISWLSLDLESDACQAGFSAPTPGQKQTQPGMPNPAACPQISVIDPDDQQWLYGVPLEMPVYAITNDPEGIDLFVFLTEYLIPKRPHLRRIYRVGLRPGCHGGHLFNSEAHIYSAIEWKGHLATKLTFKTLDQSRPEWRNPTAKSTIKLVQNSGQLGFQAELSVAYGSRTHTIKTGFDLEHYTSAIA